MGKNQKASTGFGWKHYINFGIIIVTLIVLIVLNASGALGRGIRSTMTRIAFSMVLAVSLNLVVGFLGELSLGHAGFMCVGAYIGCYISNVLEPFMGNGVLTLLVSMLSGGLCAAIAGFIIGLPALRLKGDYLAISTLAFGEIVRNIFKNLSVFGGAKGLSTNLYDTNSLFIIAIVVLLVVLYLSQNFIHSKHGRCVTAIRDNEIAARAMGVNVTFYKLFIFVLAAFFAGLAGVLYGKCIGKIEQGNFSYNYSIEILVMVVLGGMASINGSMIAAAIITYINIKLADLLSGTMAPVKLIVYALILIFMILYNNAPMFAGIREKISLRKILSRRATAKSADHIPDEADWTKIETNVKMDEVLRADIVINDGNDADKKERGGE